MSLQLTPESARDLKFGSSLSWRCSSQQIYAQLVMVGEISDVFLQIELRLLPAVMAVARPQTSLFLLLHLQEQN